jgi:L-iditol 2-dehydrogenase
MLALRLHPGGELRIHDEPDPTPDSGEVLVRVTAVGLCGSDRHWLIDGGTGDVQLDRPLILGHEFAGVVESGRLRGRLVAVDPAVPCLRCEPCRTGAANLCIDARFAGHGRTDGALRERVAWPERCLHPLGELVDDASGALVEPLAVAIRALDVGGPIDGATVGVVGCGPIGLLLVAQARAAGAAAIVATDPHRHRLAAAVELGATATVVATDESDERALAVAATGGRGLDVVFDAAGDAAAVETAVEIVRPGGQVVLVGIPSDDRTTFRASVARRKGLTIRVSRRSTGSSFRRAVELIDRRWLDLDSLVTLRVPLSEAVRGFAALVDRSGIKVVVEPAKPGSAGRAREDRPS